MDPRRIVQALQASLQPGQREDAEKLLVEMHKIIGFAPTLLQIVLEQTLDLSVRQAGAVFLKNMILKSWRQRGPLSPDEPIPFQIHEDDKANIRNVIVPAVASSTIPIQSILQVAVAKILKFDFPSRFPNFVDQIIGHLNSINFREFHGALLCLHGLVQAYEHKTNDKGPLPQAMCTLLPLLHHRISVLLSDTSDESLTLQKLILKIFYRYTDYYLPTSSINEEWVTQWHLLICSLLESFNEANEDPGSVYWKRQKWAARILYCWFTSYGSPGNVQKKYASFADWYLKRFSNQVLTTFLKICDAYRRQTFISPVVLAETLSYLSAALTHAFCWKILRPYFDTLLRDVIVPLLSFTKELAEVWEDDPLEYIRYNTSMYMSVNSPSDAAASFIKEACLKRKGILDKAMRYCTEVLNNDVKPEIKDGALHLIGTVCSILLKDRVYKEQLENFLAAHVLSLFEAPEGYRRARACWLVGKLSRVQFSNVDILCQIAMVCRHLMCSDSNLPVRVAAATTIFSLIKDQKEVEKAMNSYLPELVMLLLKLLRETEFDDLNSVLREVLVYSDELQPISVQMLQHLSGTFVKLVGVQENGVGLVSTGDSERDGEFKFDEAKEYQSLVATGVMENIETLVSVMEDNAELVASSESVIVQLVQVILKNEISDFYDEAFSLVCSITCTHVSPLLWTVYDWLYQAFSTDANDCFVSIAPSLHNYITVDPKGFIASPDRVKMFLSMCAQALQSEEEQANEGVHAAKLLEVFVLNFRGQLDSFLPEVIELAITRLTQKSTILELRIRCLLVVIATIITSSATVLPILCGHMWPETQTRIIENILKMWIDNIQKFNGLHDRRVCVFGMCTLLSLSADQRPPSVDAIAAQYLPSLLHVLTSLKDAYAAKREMEKEEESDSDADGLEVDEDADDGVAVDSDADVVDEEGTRYLELLEAVEAEMGDSDEDDDDDDDDDDYFEATSVIESFETELDKEENEMDEYVTFYQLMTQMETGDAAWYQRLVSPLSESQKTEFKEIAKTAVNCMAQKESKRIEKAGGYNFQQTDVPSSFNFSGDQPPH
ncbi:Importin-7 [Echinococcus granulosus]|uniref:Importin 7 n=1 Tax=Echinococcus granulosus TaxID=6210 RepID=A0A068WGB0_ECHGR|nr:Importin-7 [Echinococcus granulosus]CDS16640.1 importin 7 [Echinococcus granulosus]